MAHPELVVFVDGKERHRIAAPDDFGARAWLLGVVAVQVSVEDGKVVGRVRGNLTGADAAWVEVLPARAVAQVAVVPAGAHAPPLPAIEPRDPEPAAARLTLYLDGEPLVGAVLAADALADDPPRRAFGHVFSRFLPGGAVDEPGFDLTDFLSLPEGVKYERIHTGKIVPGQVVSYAFSSK